MGVDYHGDESDVRHHGNLLNAGSGPLSTNVTPHSSKDCITGEISYRIVNIELEKV